MNKTEYRVVGIWGAQAHESEIGTYETLYEAETRVDTWDNDPIYEYTKFDEVRIVKHTMNLVQRAKTAPTPPDYERVGVVDQLDAEMRHEVSGLRREIESLRSDAQDLRNICASLRADLSVVETDTIPHLEDRHVGLRHDVILDMERLEDDVDEIRDEITALRREDS